MILYWFLLLATAIIAYGIGSLSTMLLASKYVFRTRLRSLGTGNVWFSNFRRIYGIGGFIKLLMVELIKDIIPILIGGLLLGFRGHADVGRIFAGFCVILGRLYPLFYDFKGCHASVALSFVCLFADPAAGIAAAVVALAVTLLTRYVALGAAAAAGIAALVTLLVVDDALIRNLIFISAGLVIFRNFPSLVRILNGREARLSFEEDISYKLDERF